MRDEAKTIKWGTHTVVSLKERLKEDVPSFLNVCNTCNSCHFLLTWVVYCYLVIQCITESDNGVPRHWFIWLIVNNICYLVIYDYNWIHTKCTHTLNACLGCLCIEWKVSVYVSYSVKTQYWHYIAPNKEV